MLIVLFLIFEVFSFKISPIVVVPGLGGSALEARINVTQLEENHPTNGLSKFCKEKFKEWEWFWVELWDDAHLECVEYILKLTWDDSKKQCINNPGVEIRGVDFGGVGGIRYLDKSPLLQWVSRYFEDTIVYLRDHFGYVFNDTIKGLPFDFRLSPQELVNNGENGNIGFMSSLKSMIEEQYNTHHEKVTIIGHSQGVSVCSIFLSSFVTQDWKDKYIHAFISISGVWDGANEGYGYPFVGYQFPLPTWLDGPWEIIDKIQSKIFQEVFLHWPGVQWMLPKTISQTDVVLITGKGDQEKKITGKDFFTKMREHGHDQIADIYEYVSEMSINEPPRVPLHCLYTWDMKTPLQFYIDDLDQPTYGLVTEWGDGDGQVQNSNHFLCDAMKNRQNQPVNIYRTTGIGHNFLPRDKRVIDYIASVVVLE